jgi:site-specific DNA recombinase
MNGTVGLYARVSSEQQQAAGTIASQVAALRERITGDGASLHPEHTYIDDGYSGATLVRPALERLRDAAAAGQLDRLYVHSPDRLARKYAYQVVLLEELQRAGVEVLFVTHPAGQSAEDELLLQVQGMVAEYERARFAERSRRGKRYRAGCGAVSALSAAPYGYRYLPKVDGSGEARYEILLEEARVVRAMFTWVGQDRLSLGAVVHRLEEAGERTRTGKTHWDRGTIRKLLRNPAYTGRAAFGKTRCAPPTTTRVRPARGQPAYPRRSTCAHPVPPDDWITIPVPAIVSPELFAAVGEQLDENRRRARQRGDSVGHLLAGLLCCGCCGYAYVATSTADHHEQRRQHAYYRCTGTEAYRFGGTRICDNRAVRLDHLDALVWREVQGVLADPTRLETEYTRRVTEGATEQADETTASLASRLRAARRGRERLIDGYAEGMFTQQDIAPRLLRLDERIASLERQQHDAEAAADQERDLRLVIATVDEFAATMRGHLEQADEATKRSLIRALVKRIEVHREAVHIVFRIAPLPNDPGAPPDCSPHCGRGGGAVPTPVSTPSPAPIAPPSSRAGGVSSLHQGSGENSEGSAPRLIFMLRWRPGGHGGLHRKCSPAEFTAPVTVGVRQAHGVPIFIPTWRGPPHDLLNRTWSATGMGPH